MEKSTISTEAIILIILLVIGLFGAKAVLSSKDDSPGLALPRQESPAVVMAPKDASTSEYWKSER